MSDRPRRCGAVTVRSCIGLVGAAAAVVFASTGGLHAQCSTPGDAFAFLVADPPHDPSCPADPIVRFVTPEVVFECGFFAQAAHAIACGTGDQEGCVQLCRDAAASWNTDLPGRFRFTAADAARPVAFCDSADGRTSVGGGERMCDGSVFPANVLAVTLRVMVTGGPTKGEQLDADIVVNPQFNGSFTPNLFLATVAHELGHVLGLDHPDACMRDAPVLMRSKLSPGDPCFVRAPVIDDVNGAIRIYPLVGPTPAPRLCGDADGSGRVNVVDAENILRAVVGLPSGCVSAPAQCDVDGVGGITVIDAASVLRQAGGLPFADACPE